MSINQVFSLKKVSWTSCGFLKTFHLTFLAEEAYWQDLAEDSSTHRIPQVLYLNLISNLHPNFNLNPAWTLKPDLNL